MAYFGDSDLDTMLSDSPNSITIAGVTKQCEFAERDEVVQEEQGQSGQIVRMAVATVKTLDFPSVMGGASCTVDGIAYSVWRRLRIGDGATTELWLRKV